MKRYLFSISIMLCGWLTMTAKDCGPTLQTINPTIPDIYTQNGELNISFDIDVTSLELGKNQEVIYTPVLLNVDGTKGAEFGKIVIKGRNTSILSERHGARKIENVAVDVTRNDGAQQTVTYTANIPYEQWMENSTLYLAEDLCGCGAIQSQDRMEMAAFNNEAVEVTDVLSLMVEPKLEKPKIRYEKGSAFVDFVVDKYAINPDYRNNKVELAKIISTIDLVKNDNNVDITNIDIHGYASPEGSYKHNEFLAEKRTSALTNYVMDLYTIPHTLFSQQSTPEDWEGLRNLMVNSDLEAKEDILAIIDSTNLTPDEKDGKIKTDYPGAYSYMLQEWYPSLRRSDYTISYEVRPFTPEEALEIMKVHPKHVSLYEMFWAGQSLGVNSEGYNEVVELAVATYPDEPVANYNAAIVAINKGEYDKARKYLTKLPENGETLNLRGVTELNAGNYAGAADYFQKAADKGYAKAADNLKLIESLKQYKKQNR